MGGYIGATAVGLTTTAADVQGDITSTDTTPELILKNTSEEDTEGGREGKITFKGEQSGGEESTLAQIESAHDGTSDDEKGDLIFKTNDGSDGASPTERMRIDSAGDIGIGNTDPQSRVHILSNNTGFVASNGAGIKGIQASLTSGNSENLYMYTSSGAGFNRAGTTHVGRIESYGNNMLEIGSQQNTAIVFGTGNAERARFNASDGKLKLGDQNDSAHTFTGGNILQTEFGNAYGNNHVVWAVGAHTAAYNVQVFRNGNGIVGHIQTSGSATSYQTSSDYRLKENVVDITDGITRVKQLSPRRFNFIADADTTVDGFIAHEAQTVVPEAVSGTKDGMMDEEYEVTPAEFDDDGRIINDAVMGTRSVPDIQGIDQAKLVPLLTAALQEAIAKIETLETKVAALEAE